MDLVSYGLLSSKELCAMLSLNPKNSGEQTVICVHLAFWNGFDVRDREG